MNDLISRQAAIDILASGDALLSRALDDMDVVGVERDKFEWGLGLIDSYIEDFKELPSVNQWIPCSERLPESEDMYQRPDNRYLCQLEAYGQRKFCVCSRLKGAVSAFWDWYGVPFKDSEVIAWMPLPEPYKGEEK